MIRITTVQLWVHDQDEALDFYTKKVGLELRADVTMPELGDFRWLTVGPAGQEDVAIVLMAIPGPPVMDEATAQQVRDLSAKGFAGTVFLTTDDAQASYEEPHGPDGFWTRLASLRPPALFIWGRGDRLVPFGFAAHVRRTVPQAEHLELDCGHVPQLERPKETHDAIRGFLARIPVA